MSLHVIANTLLVNTVNVLVRCCLQFFVILFEKPSIGTVDHHEATKAAMKAVFCKYQVNIQHLIVHLT